jgi:hypothetical protein
MDALHYSVQLPQNTMTVSGSRSSSRPSAPTPKPAAPKPAAVTPEVEEQEVAAAAPVVERISIGSLVVKKTTYDDGESRLSEVKTIKSGPDERFKSWRHAQPL